MKTTVFIGDDVNLKTQLEKTAHDVELKMISIESIGEYSDIDLLIISDQSIGVLELEGLILNTKAKKVFYLISNGPKSSIIENKITVAKQLNIEFIMPRSSVKAIVNRILGISDSHVLPNVIGVMGTHAQVGVTSTVLAIAKAMASKELKVCVLGFNQFNSGISWYNNYEGNTFDELYEQLVDNRSSLSPEKLIQFMHYDQHRNFHYLAGNKDFTKENYFGVEEIDQLLKAASQNFDIVLLDLGNRPTNYLTIRGLESSDLKLIVANQQPVSSSLWDQMNSDILRLLQITKEEFLMIINRYNYQLTVDQKMLSTQMSVHTIGLISDFGAEAVNCEFYRNLFTESKNRSTKREANNQINDIAAILLTRLSSLEMDKQKEKKGWKMGR